MFLPLQKFASEGLRTLVLGIKDLTAKEFEAWKSMHHEAAISMEDRETKLDLVYDEIEKNLELLGATAIEDKLQVRRLRRRASCGCCPLGSILGVPLNPGNILDISLVPTMQEGVAQTIANLSVAGIKIWVLTGDKQETAINIGYSCQLLTDELTEEPFIVDGETFEVRSTRIRINHDFSKCGLGKFSLSCSSSP